MIKREKSIILFRWGQKAVKALFSALFLACLIFTSCDNLTGTNTLDPTGSNNSATKGSSPAGKTCYVTVYGSIDIGGAMPEEIAQAVQNPNVAGEDNSSRTAFPSIPTTGLSYDVKAVNTADSSETYTGEALTDDGNVTYRVGIPATEAEKNYKVKISVIYNEKVILSGESEEFTISTSSPVATKDITLSAKQTGSNTALATMRLEVEVSSSLGINYARAYCSFEGEEVFIPATSSASGWIFTFGNNTSGSLDLDFQFFYGDDEYSNKAYSFTENINFFDNMETNTWVQNGAEPWFVTTGTGSSKTTTCRITAAMVEGFKLTDIYVDPTLTISGSGTFLNPVKSFNDAIEKLTDATKGYTINLKGSYNLLTIPTSINASTLTVCDNSATIKTFAQNAAIPVTFKNLTIENAGAVSHGGGIKNQGNLTLDNCIIQSCDGDVFNGGGVFNNGTLNLLSGTITGNTAQNGAGVYIEDGAQMTMSGGTISGNESGGSSGAVHVGTNSLFTMTGGTISGNKSDVGEGGGLFIESPGTFIMSGGTISGNSAISGGALYVEGTFKISGSAYIPAGVNGVTGVGKNDVRIIGNNKIKIAGKLTPPAACTDGIVATITPASYTAGTQIIELDTGVTDTTLEEAAAHFAVTQPVDGTNLFFVSNEGKLATITPVLSFDNGEEDGTQTNPDNGKVYDVVKYSYLGDDNLKVSAVNPYEDSGFAIDLLVDGTSGDLTARTVDDGYHTLTIRVSKAGYASVDISKRVYVKIKPVKVTIGQIEVYFDTNGEGSHSSGQAYISGDGYAAHEMYIEGDVYPDASSKKKTCRTVVDNSNDGRTGNSDNAVTYKYNPDSTKNYVYLTEKTSKFYFYTNRARCTYMNVDLCQINKDDSTTTRTLSSLKPTDGRSFATGDVNWAGNHVSGGGCPRGYYSFSVSLDDSEDPPAP